MNYPTTTGGECCPSEMSRPTITARLTKERDDLNARLSKINEALDLMEQNPDIAKVLDALGRTYL